MSDPEPSSPLPPESPGSPDHPGRGSGALRVLRRVALVGTGAVVAWNVVSLARIEPRQEYGFHVLVLAGVAVGLALRVLLPDAARRLRRHPDLLVPLGLYVTADTLLTLLAKLPGLAALLTPSWPVKIFSLSIGLSLFFVIEILLGLIYAGWTTVLVLQAVRRDRVDPVRAVAGVRRWFPRVLAAEFVGWAVFFAGLAVAVAIGTNSVELAMLLIGVGGLVWNLATAALLPVAVAEEGSLGQALRAGLRVSWAGKRRWWRLVVAQMVLLGCVTYIAVSFTHSPRPGVFQTQSRSTWHVHGFWAGGYPDACHWHTDLMQTVEAEPLPLVTTLLGLIFAVLAIAIKLRITADVYGPRPAEGVAGDAVALSPAEPGRRE